MKTLRCAFTIKSEEQQEVAGAMSMAAGEYMSVGSQTDSERADLLREAEALHEEPELERDELADIHEGRKLPRGLAEEVADALML